MVNNKVTYTQKSKHLNLAGQTELANHPAVRAKGKIGESMSICVRKNKLARHTVEKLPNFTNTTSRKLIAK